MLISPRHSGLNPKLPYSAIVTAHGVRVRFHEIDRSLGTTTLSSQSGAEPDPLTRRPCLTWLVLGDCLGRRWEGGSDFLARDDSRQAIAINRNHAEARRRGGCCAPFSASSRLRVNHCSDWRLATMRSIASQTPPQVRGGGAFVAGRPDGFHSHFAPDPLNGFLDGFRSRTFADVRPADALATCRHRVDAGDIRAGGNRAP